jgi:adenylylsulfate kinase
MNESHLRSIVKAISWRIFGTLATMLITYFFTHKIDIAIYIGIFEFISKIVLFYIHERIWVGISQTKFAFRAQKT